MGSKSIYSVVAVVGIAAASGAAWWVQHKPKQPVAAGELAPTGQPAAGTAAAPAPGGRGGVPSVEVARVEIMRIMDDAQAVGSLRSRQSVVLRPEVSGRVTQINFRDADRVRRGQLLVQLDDQLPQAQVKQAEAELSIARANHRRNQELVEQKFIAQRAVDESAANLQVAEAKLALARATLARLKILAPFDGVAGIRNISVGDYLKDGADIVNIEDLDAMYVDFRLPERYQTKVRPGQTAVIEVDALPGQRFHAFIQAVDPLLDANGRSVGIRGCIDNRQMQLRPGMFARVTPVFGVREGARVIPEEAIVPQGGRQYVYKLVDGPDQDTRIAQRVEVKVGIRQPGKVEITEGLVPGDTVVTAGQQRIQKDGTPVRVLDLRGGNGSPTAAAGAAPAGGPGRKSAAMDVPAARAGNPCAPGSAAATRTRAS
ncbi:efflux RND transporter periplasmic adaptor subunit [Ramlibacter sp. USB13]|uniref:Efflux RND transporter periplasmic adaptor subunit n=1 Tax=Ramlibacter cellulosilyticus TaxID=2764187 RepID=A0A923MQ15_9BURK|nr:efflux RND transporter periplasmic adaptor subunit [Ramlibacter cellulosilyticus]MBC5783380.1 efflux RND transporter periplasmic adaptor subunit [Ramlibacter cellulosilyticus]